MNRISRIGLIALLLGGLCATSVNAQEGIEIKAHDFQLRYRNGVEAAAIVRQFFSAVENRGRIVILNLPEGDWVLTTKWCVITNSVKLYEDDLTISVGTDGALDPNSKSGETEGVKIKFQPHHKYITAVTVIGKERPTPMQAARNLEMPQYVWHDIKIVKKGDKLEIFFVDMKAPKITYPIDDRIDTSSICIYNREIVGPPHEADDPQNEKQTTNENVSLLAGLTVRELK